MNKRGYLSSREFIKLAWNTLLAAGGISVCGGTLKFLSHKSKSVQVTHIELGAKTDYPLGSVTALPDDKIILIHDKNGYTAIDTTCSHLGCQVKLEGDELACPCHGSRFDLEGNPVHGPAKNPLSLWKVEETQDGNLVLDKVPQEKVIR
jgi:cytochrome b6-f complex iron-sulfur subunit